MDAEVEALREASAVVVVSAGFAWLGVGRRRCTVGVTGKRLSLDHAETH